MLLLVLSCLLGRQVVRSLFGIHFTNLNSFGLWEETRVSTLHTGEPSVTVGPRTGDLLSVSQEH